MAVINALIAARDQTIDSVLRIPRAETLNHGPLLVGPATDAPALAAELRAAMNRLKVEAVSADGSQVDYAKARASEAYRVYRADLTPRLRTVNVAARASRGDRLAFWINLYNALVVDAVIQYRPRASVAEGPLGVVRFFRRAAYDVGGVRFSLDDIEHGVLRGNQGFPYFPGPQFATQDLRRQSVILPADPRIHFALNCASRSCPPIGVYDGARIDAQLDLATRSFVAATTRVDAARARVTTSALFKWYAGDFGGREGVLRFLVAHLPEGEERAWLATYGARARMRHSPYDWGLNAATLE